MRQCENCGAYLDPEERCDCEQDKVPDKDIVQVLQKEYSGYDQPLHSKIKNPGKYGIMRTPRAERILRRAFPRETRKRRGKENRKRGNKHTFRLDEAEEGRLQTAMARLGIEHLQDFVLLVFHWFFSELFLTVGTWVNDNVLQPVKDKVSDFFSVGKDLITGIWNGIENKIEWLKSKVKGLVDIIKGWFTGKDGFDNNSPSKWGIKMGITIPQGIGIGLDRGLGEALSSASNVISRIKGTLTDTGGSVETNGSSNSVKSGGTAPQYVFHIYAKDKETAVEAADATLAAFQRGRWAVST